MTAVLFDLDGVLLDSEETWDRARRAVVDEGGGTWRPEATRTMMGMSAPEWSRYLHDELGVAGAPAEISERVVVRVLDSYQERLPLVPHAVEVVRDLARSWTLGLASSSNRSVIEVFLDRSGLRGAFQATVSSEEVDHGKPAPDVYLAVADRLGVDPSDAVAIEDSTNGIRAALAAGARVIAAPNRTFPPDPEVLSTADAVVESLEALRPAIVRGLATP